MEVQDVPAIVQAAHAAGALVAMDNTWSAGVYFDALAHGVDVTMQALTKYVGGHSDLLLGSVTREGQGRLQATGRYPATSGMRGLAGRLQPGVARHEDAGRPFGENRRIGSRRSHAGWPPGPRWNAYCIPHSSHVPGTNSGSATLPDRLAFFHSCCKKASARSRFNRSSIRSSYSRLAIAGEA